MAEGLPGQSLLSFAPVSIEPYPFLDSALPPGWVRLGKGYPAAANRDTGSKPGWLCFLLRSHSTVQLADLLQEGWILNTGCLGYRCIIRIAETEVDHRLILRPPIRRLTNCVPTKKFRV